MNPPHAMLRKGKYLLLLFVLGACTEGTNAQQEQDEPQELRNPQPAVVDARALPDFRPLVREYGDAVVNVEVLQRRERCPAATRAPLEFASPPDPHCCADRMAIREGEGEVARDGGREMLEARAAYEEAVSVRQGAQETLRLYGISAASLEPGDPGASLLPVHAPISGRVIEKHATLGELATPEDILFTIGDLGHVWVWIDVYERDLARVHLDDDVEVTVEPFPERTFSGEVTYFSPEVASETRTVRARIDVDNPERLLRPGMFAAIRLVDPHTEEATPSLVVPDDAVVRRGGETLVFVPVPGPAGERAGARFEVRPVTLGRAEGEWVEVLSGLDAGDRVVTTGTFFLESELARHELGGGHSH